MSRTRKITPADIPNKRKGWCKCSYCINGKMHKHRKNEISFREQIKEYKAA